MSSPNKPDYVSAFTFLQVFMKQRPMEISKHRLLSFSTYSTDFVLARELLGPKSDVTGSLIPLQLPPFGISIEPMVTSRCSSIGMFSLEFNTLEISDITLSAFRLSYD
jgi:hypothetical protein